MEDVNICSIGYMLNFWKNNTSEKLVKLFDLHNEFNKFVSGWTETNNNGDCVDKCATMYITYVNECHNDNDSDFCNELENFREPYDTFMANVTLCEGKITNLPPAKTGDFIVIILIPYIIILIISFIIFAIYKFTPNGSLLYKRIRNKKRVWNNLYEQNEQLLHTSQMMNRDSENSSYYLSYDSAQYS
ncbi:PIR Superfamily Protein [Plasmodium ovale curtisi]|uniref:PIR Superfamily Protein n=1 Tax=Plasmodium ovale curtisi TaxID=864141 RepID=A0A1A8X4E7_PLAOA|nr:PIR Superfamily Protein [Plasmodium ovale curtisi]